MGTDNEHIEVLVTEVAELINILMDTFASDETGDLDLVTVAQGLERYVQQVAQVATIAEAGQWMGLYNICVLYQAALVPLVGNPEALNEPLLMLLESWPSHVMTYLETPSNPGASSALIECLQDPNWIAPLQADEAAILKDILAEQAAGAPIPAESEIREEMALSDHIEDTAALGVDDSPAQDESDGVFGTNSPTDEGTALESLPIEPEALAFDLGTETVDASTSFQDEQPTVESAPLDDIFALQELEASIPESGSEDSDMVWHEDIVDPGPLAADEAVIAETPGASDGLAFDDSFQANEGIAETADDADALAFDNSFEAANDVVESDEFDMQETLPDPLAETAPIDADSALEPETLEAVETVQPIESEVLETARMEGEAALQEDVEVEELDNTAKELIALLSFEVSQFTASLAGLLDEETAEDWRPILADHLEEIERLRDGAEAAGLNGLQQACEHIGANVLNLAAQEEPIASPQRHVIAGWPQIALAYLEHPQAHDARIELVQYLRDPRWLEPLSDEHCDILVDTLGVLQLDIIEDEATPRKRHAQLEDVTLTLPEDVNPELLDSLLQELPRQAADFTAAIQRLTTAEGSLANVEVAQRVAHTLKGAANTVGVPGVANLTHYLEDILLALSQFETLPNAMLNEALINAADCLEMMNEALVGVSEPSPPEEFLRVLQEVLDWANFIDPAGVLDVDMQPVARESLPGLVTENTHQESEAVQPQATAAGVSGRISADLVDELLRLAGEAMILNGQLRDRLTRTTQQMQTIRTQNNHLQQLVFELEHLVDVRGLASPMQQHVSIGEFDPLEMEQYNELHTVSRRLLEAVTDAREFTHDAETNLVALSDVMTAQQKIQQESEETVMRTRMVPVKTIAPRLQRGIRQACRLTGKEAELELGGAETLIDGNVLNSMVDPLMHMLRNAVDHGLELPEAREQIGKPRSGTIHLDFVREGNLILIRCRDDGAGLNYDAIRNTALERGLIRDSQVLSEDELGRLIMQPGFSTRSETTQVSGRGIGMDAVYTRIQELKGSLHLTSTANQGCQIELRLPVTLMSTHALLVRIDQEVFAVSDRGIEQILYPGAGELGQVGNKTTYQLGHEVFEATTLWQALQRRAPQADEQLGLCPALLIREDSGRNLIVLVQEVVDSQTLVVKNLGHYIPDIRGVVGATILGDGRVTPVLDLPELLSAPVRASSQAVRQDNTDITVQRHARTALVVDDSLSARRALAEFVTDLGFEVFTAGDGLEAVAVLEQHIPDILLVDLEMPRMNGLELTAHIRSRDATKHVPVIMITSRSTEKHRQNADQAGVNMYLVKPFSEDELATHVEQLTSLRGVA